MWHHRTTEHWESGQLVDSSVALTVHVMRVSTLLLSQVGRVCSTASISAGVRKSPSLGSPLAAAVPNTQMTYCEQKFTSQNPEG